MEHVERNDPVSLVSVEKVNCMISFCSNSVKILKSCRTEIRQIRKEIFRLQQELSELRLQLGEHECCSRQRQPFESLAESEMSVFSQWGQDGILQFLISRVEGIPETFIEFGVQDYRESNTRFLLEHNNWKGLVLDADPENIRSIESRRGAWRYPLTVKKAFINRDNINQLILDAGFKGDLGLLVIDIDGNDYHIWDSIEAVKPVLVVIEYNSRLGPEEKVTIPYDSQFERSRAHYSGIYYGASLAALQSLGRRKGYSLLGCNLHGNDAFFIRNDWRPEALPVVSVEEAFRRAKSQEGKDEKGNLVRRSAEEEAEILRSLKWETLT